MNTRVGKKRNIVLAVVSAVVMCACTFLFSNKVMATYPFTNYQECLDTSNNPLIQDVQDRCLESLGGSKDGPPPNTSYNYCSLWISDAENNGRVIRVDQPSGEYTLYYYGMCVITSGAYNCDDPLPGDCASFGIAQMVLEGDNGSIGVATDWKRGTWGNPNTKETKMDVAKFISGVMATSCEDDEYDCYKRTITIWRSNPRTPDSLYDQEQEIIVAVKKARYRLTLKALDIDEEREIKCNDTYPVNGEYFAAGKRASVVRQSISDSTACNSKYEFAGFAKTTADAYAENFVETTSTSESEYVSSSGWTYYVKGIDENKTRYAAYRKKEYTMTLYSCDSDGNSLSGVSGLGNSSTTVKYGAKASLTRGLGAEQGYGEGTFKGFVYGATNCATAANATATEMVTTTDPGAAIYVSGSSNPEETINVKSLTTNAKVFAIYELPDLRLTEYAVDALGNPLDSVIPPIVDTKRYGQAAKVCRPSSEPAGLTFKFWASSRQNAKKGVEMTSGVSSDKKCYEVTSLTESKDVYVVYDVSFEGKSNVVGTSVMNWRSTDGTARVELSNCSSTSGCKVKFVHSLRQLAKYGSTSWNVMRKSNYWDGEFGGENNVQVKSGKFDSAETTTTDGSKDVYTSREYKLKPGMFVCEILSFNKTIGTSEIVKTKVCATATGTAQQGDTTLLDIDVKNINVSMYGDYGDGPIYAKPGDKVSFEAVYEPKLQYVYSVIPEGMKIDGGSLISNSNQTLQALFNANRGSLSNWNNAFSIDCENFECNLASSVYTIGDSAKKSPTNDHVVTSGDVGKVLSEKALTNARNDTKTTPSQVVFSESSNKNVANVITAPIEDTASVIVPYNFATSTYIKTSSSDVVYAGETTSITYAIAVEKKRNDLTGGTEYATKVPGAKTSIEVSLDGGATWISSSEETILGQDLNPNGGAGEVGTFTKSVNVPDLSAGSQFCARSVVWPQNSGADSNIDPAGFQGTAKSPVVCFVIAKKPSFQVWGGEVFINGNTTVPVSQKRNLNGGYTITGGSNKYTFGSWTELGLIGNKTIKGIASGAALGYSGTGLVAEPGGEKDSTNCKRSVLSFANSKCSSSVGNISSTSLFDTALLDSLKGIVKKLVPSMKDVNVSGHINLNSDYAVDETNGAHYSYAGSNNISVGESSATVIASGVTHIVYSDKTVTIDGDIIYESGSYTSLVDIPKLFIYGNNINIACNVNRIDAVLMTKGTINTCYDSSDVNSAANSNQLRINGVIMAKSLKLMRTYGAGTGNNSIVPAEIINYDSSMYLWALKDFSTMSEATPMDGEVVEVFRRELAPRY